VDIGRGNVAAARRKRLTDVQLLTVIQAIHKALKGAYGSPRMVRELRARHSSQQATRRAVDA
jgi:putative transposase